MKTSIVLLGIFFCQFLAAQKPISNSVFTELKSEWVAANGDKITFNDPYAGAMWFTLANKGNGYPFGIWSYTFLKDSIGLHWTASATAPNRNYDTYYFKCDVSAGEFFVTNFYNPNNKKELLHFKKVR